MAVGACDLGLANATLAAGGERPFWEAFFFTFKNRHKTGTINFLPLDVILYM